MARFDAVIEAVRYKGNRIELVRAYERRGAAFSDRVILDRPALLAGLEKGKRFVTGQRVELLAGTFEVGKSLILASLNGEPLINTGGSDDRDQLEGVPLF